jgi:acyl-coenzyme A synthetase/AMP-(fatty) acid ligase
LYIRDAINKYLQKADGLYNASGQLTEPTKLRQLVDALGAALIQGEHYKNPVGIYLNRDWRYLAVIMASLRSGVVWVPLSREWPKSWTKHIVEKSQIDLILGEDGDEPSDHFPLVPLDDFLTMFDTGSEYESPELFPERCAYIRFTSGSTGQPKGAIISRRSLENHLRWIDEYFSVTSDDRLLFVSQLTFDLTILDIGLLILKHPDFLFSNFEGDIFKLIVDIESNAVTTIVGAPTLFNLLLQDGIADRWNTKLLKNIIVAGSRFPYGLYQSMSSYLRHAMVDNSYGPTEATNLVSTKRLSWHEKEDIQDRNVSVGSAVPNMSLSILCDDGSITIRALVTGELLISGVQLMDRYVSDPQRTAEFLFKQDGTTYYRSGDLAYFDEKKDCYIVGRVDDTVKIKSHRINLLDIDSYLQSLKGVQNSATVAIEKNDLDSEMVTYVVAAATVDQDDVKKHLSGLLPKEQIPNIVVFTDTLPVNKSGKIDRKLLVDIHKGGDRSIL